MTSEMFTSVTCNWDFLTTEVSLLKENALDVAVVLKVQQWQSNVVPIQHEWIILFSFEVINKIKTWFPEPIGEN